MVVFILELTLGQIWSIRTHFICYDVDPWENPIVSPSIVTPVQGLTVCSKCTVILSSQWSCVLRHWASLRHHKYQCDIKFKFTKRSPGSCFCGRALIHLIISELFSFVSVVCKLKGSYGIKAAPFRKQLVHLIKYREIYIYKYINDSFNSVKSFYKL